VGIQRLERRGFLGGEVKDLGRTLPRAAITGTLIIMVLYVMVNAAYFYVGRHWRSPTCGNIARRE
jgi:hypothetical protein